MDTAKELAKDTLETLSRTRGTGTITCTLDITNVRSYLYRYMHDLIVCSSNHQDIYCIYQVGRRESKSGQGILLFEFQDLNEALGSQIKPKYVEMDQVPKTVVAEIKQLKSAKYPRFSDVLFQDDASDVAKDDPKMYHLPVAAHLKTQDISSHLLFWHRLKQIS